MATSCSAVSVYPSPGTATASPETQISFRGASVARLRAAAIQVVGSQTGTHPGRLVQDSDHDGASFYPTTPFNAGETVAVKTKLAICGASGGTWSFGVARPANPAPPAPGRPATPSPSVTASEIQSFQSAPTLSPPALTVDVDRLSGGNDIFLAPKGGPGQAGLMIVDSHGQLVWFDPLAAGAQPSDLRIQAYQGQPVLTWWQGQVGSGHGAGVDYIANDSYQVIATVRAGNGYQADLHEFLVTPQGAAWITAYNAVDWDLASVGGPKHGAVWDGIVQEIDIKTGNVLFEWHSLDHISVTASYQALPTPTNALYDYFHVNSIDPSTHGTVLISARNAHAVYELNQSTGTVLWQLNGKHSSFSMGPGTKFALQHDAEFQANGTLTIFDDEDVGSKGPQARGIVLSLDLQKRAVSLLRRYTHRPALDVPAQGNVQLLPGGGALLGWGSGSFVTEYDPNGNVVFDATFPQPTNSYRAYSYPWAATPNTLPEEAATISPTGDMTVYASWNGATGIARWQVRTGADPKHLKVVATRAKAGFETVVTGLAQSKYVAVVALDSRGRVLAESIPEAQEPSPGA